MLSLKTSKPRRGRVSPGNKKQLGLNEPGQKANGHGGEHNSSRSGRTLPTDPARMAMNWRRELLAQTSPRYNPRRRRCECPIAPSTNPSADRVDPRPFLPQSRLVRSIDPPDTDADRSRRSFPEQEGERRRSLFQVGPMVHSKATSPSPRCCSLTSTPRTCPLSCWRLAARFVCAEAVFERLMFLVEQAHGTTRTSCAWNNPTSRRSPEGLHRADVPQGEALRTTRANG